MSEYWEKIVAGREVDPALYMPGTSALQSSTQSDPKLETVLSAAGIVKAIFTDIAANDPQIQEARVRAVTITNSDMPGAPARQVSLRWGDKLVLTPEDEAIIAEYQQAGRFGKFFGCFPEVITKFNYSLVEASIGTSDLAIVSDFGWLRRLYPRVSIEDFINNPDILLPDISKALQKPGRVLRRTYLKELAATLPRS